MDLSIGSSYHQKIEAYIHGDMANIGIPGAYIHTETDEHMIMLLKGKLSEMMLSV